MRRASRGGSGRGRGAIVNAYDLARWRAGIAERADADVLQSAGGRCRMHSNAETRPRCALFVSSMAIVRKSQQSAVLAFDRVTPAQILAQAKAEAERFMSRGTRESFAVRSSGRDRVARSAIG